MKKVLATILFFIYLTATSGMGMNLHYCCDRLDKVEVSFTGKALHADDSCGMQAAYKGKDCCKDVHKQLKITEAQNTAADIMAPSGPLLMVVTLPSFVQIPTPYFSSIAKGSFSPHSPPFRAAVPAYLKNCSFLI